MAVGVLHASEKPTEEKMREEQTRRAETGSWLKNIRQLLCV